MMADNECEVIVAGAGPTGLLCAALLARRGVRVRIFDKNADQAHESRALVVQPRTLELFLGIGLAEEMLARGTTVTSARMFVDGQVQVELHFDDINRRDTPYSSMLIASQSDTEAVLNDELRRLGIAVERSVEVIGLAQTEAEVTARARGADGAEFELRAKYLVGGDGAHSFVRKALGLSFEGAAYPQNFLLADCRVDGLPFTDGFGIFLHGTSLAVFFPLPGEPGRARIITMDPTHGGDTDQSLSTQGGRDAPLSAVQTSFRGATQSEATLSDPTWTSLYRVHHRGVDRYRVNRVFVAGDAAHIHSPAGGQGMNTGLQDAANLAWKLVLALRGQARANELLGSYHDERWPVGQRVLKVTDEMFSTMTSQSGWFATVRNALVPKVAGILSHAEFVRSRVFNFVSQLGIRYGRAEGLLDESGRGATHFWKRGPASGHRAPDASYARNQDVFGLLTGYKFHVLALSRTPLAGEESRSLSADCAALPQPPGVGLEVHVIAIPSGKGDEPIIRAEALGVFSAYGLDPETPRALYLVRPDGYVAWRADRFDVKALANFVRTRFC
jgi:2-polyprenyl-6-methoxyphenol hydroxylase-like FAD-dependent oxidoreductase